MSWAHPDLPARVGAMSLHEAVTQSSGSTLVDAGLGALAGYLAAPSAAQRLVYVAGGAAATSLAGVFGLLALLGAAYIGRK